MRTNSQQFTEKMSNSRTVQFGQMVDGSDMYYGTIRDQFGVVESVITCLTQSDVVAWITEHE